MRSVLLQLAHKWNAIFPRFLLCPIIDDLSFFTMRIPYDFPPNTSMRQRLGLWRSVITYYWLPDRRERLRRLYAHFLQPGDLFFDVGAHVGNHVAAGLEMGARAVGIEPQPLCMHFLQRWYGAHPNVHLRAEALGAAPGVGTLLVSQRTPTVSTVSRAWADEVRTVDSFTKVQWDAPQPVQMTTLDALIADHGVPSFCKIDVEGYEWEVLCGLTQPLRALSFEYIPATAKRALACVRRISALGPYEFNWSVGETYAFQSAVWLSPAEMAATLSQMAPGARSGDVYARSTRPFGQ